MSTPLDNLTIYKELEHYLTNPQYRVFDNGLSLGLKDPKPTVSFLVLDTTQTYQMTERGWYRPLILEFVMKYHYGFSNGIILQSIIKDETVQRYRKLKLLAA